MTKHTIRDILPPEHRQQRRRSPAREEQPPEHDEVDTGGQPPMQPPQRPDRPLFDESEPMDLPPKPHRGGGKIKYAFYGLGVVVVIFILSVLFSLFFAGAEVIVKPKTESLTVNGDFQAVAKGSGNGELQYDIMTVEALQTATVPATGSEDVEEKASGEITIYNTYNDSPQRLIRNTRFESPDGLIYRIDKSVVVPGMDGDTPGSVEVTVYADEPGERYNIGITDFTIPGFKGAPQYETFYAESKTAMTGGFVGERLIVEDSVLEAQRTSLQETLRNELQDQFDGQEPDGFISLPGATFIDFQTQTPNESGDELEIREKGVLYSVIFEEQDLAGYLAKNTLGTFDNSDVTFLGEPSLTLMPLAAEPGAEVRPWEDDVFNFSITGSADIVWLFDEEGLKEDLSGRNKEAIHTILSGYPSIDEAEVVIRPFWKGSFPGETEEITIQTVIEGQ